MAHSGVFYISEQQRGLQTSRGLGKIFPYPLSTGLVGPLSLIYVPCQRYFTPYCRRSVVVESLHRLATAPHL